MSELGNLLRKTREDSKKSLKDVCNETRIRESFLQFIEEGRYNELPSYLHVYGFVKKYAEFLGFNYERDISHIFNAECPKPGANAVSSVEDNENTSDIQEKAAVQDSGKKSPVLIILILIILAGAGYGGYFLYTQNQPYNFARSDNTGVMPAAPVVTPDYSEDNGDNSSYTEYGEGASIYDNVSEQDNLTANRSDNNLSGIGGETGFFDSFATGRIPDLEPVTVEPEEVTVRFSEDCWFKYSTDRGETKEITAQRGTVIRIEFDKTFRIDIGNAYAVSIDYKDQTYSSFGARNAARTNLNYEVLDGKLELVRRR
ncbi:MAG: DUF4115 domain-containing protein [Mucispirillum sp.]|nr:DUF4115 domain-containing protein [Mucispirillum sp.]